MGYDRTRLSTADAVWARATVKYNGKGPTYIVIAVLGPSSSAPTPPPATRRRPPSPARSTLINSHKQAARPSEPGRLVLELVAAMPKEYSIDPQRIYLTGLSMGGYGTWDLLARKPDLFAAGVPVCGGGDESTAGKIAKIPIRVFHGDLDSAVPVSRSRTMVEALKKAGGHPKYTEYPGVGHNSWDKAYADPKLMNWLFKQKKG